MSYTKTELKALSDEELVHAELQLDRDLWVFVLERMQDR